MASFVFDLVPACLRDMVAVLRERGPMITAQLDSVLLNAGHSEHVIKAAKRKGVEQGEVQRGRGADIGGHGASVAWCIAGDAVPTSRARVEAEVKRLKARGLSVEFIKVARKLDLDPSFVRRVVLGLRTGGMNVPIRRARPRGVKDYCPTPAQIAAECAKIRAEWSKAETQARYVGHAPRFARYGCPFDRVRSNRGFAGMHTVGRAS